MAKNTSGSQGANRQASLLKESQALAKALGLEYENIVDLQEMILNNQIKSTDELLKQVKAAREAQTRIENELNLEKEKTKQKEKQRAAEKDIKDLADELAKPLRKIANMTDEILENDLARIQKAKELGAISEKEANLQENLLKTYTKLSKNPIVKSGFSEAANTLDSMQSSIDDFMKKLPGGEMISKAFGLDKFGERLQTQLLESGGVGAAGLVAGLTAAFAVLKMITDEANQLATETGLTFGQARKLADESRSVAASYGIQLATAKDIIDVQKEAISQFGTMAMLTNEQAANVAELGKSFGYGAAQAGKINSAFMLLGATSDEAYQAQQSLAVESLKAGVNVGAVTKDIADNAKSTAKYFSGNVQALKKAAVEAAKMGVSLGTMSKVADRLLDIEASLNAQFEFQAMTGRQINLDKARELSLNNDIAGATKEILDAVGSATEFDNLHFKAKEKLAAATGMEVDELQKSLIIRERLGELTDEERAAMTGLNLSAKALAEMGDNELRAKLAEQQSLNETTKKLDDFKNIMMNAIVPLAETLGFIFQMLTPVIEGILIPFRAMSYVMTLLGQGIDYLIEKFSWLSPVITFIKDTFLGIGAVITTVMLPGLIRAGYESIKLGVNALKAAIPSIFKAFSMMGPLGLLGAGAAVAGMMALYRSVGDYGEGNGPAVYSPRENTIFQGTPNDQVVMAPGAYDAATSGGGGSVIVNMTETNNLLRELLTAMKTPVPVQIGTRVITELGNELNADKSYRQGYNSLGGR